MSDELNVEEIERANELSVSVTRNVLGYDFPSYKDRKALITEIRRLREGRDSIANAVYLWLRAPAEQREILFKRLYENIVEGKVPPEQDAIWYSQTEYQAVEKERDTLRERVALLEGVAEAVNELRVSKDGFIAGDWNRGWAKLDIHKWKKAIDALDAAGYEVGA